MFGNLEISYRIGERVIYVPSAQGRAVGRQLRALLTRHRFEPFYRHLGGGSSIDILHAHRGNGWFATADLARFYPSIGRAQVSHALAGAGIEQHRHFAKWSTVRGADGGYVLPAGFPQSPVLATLVMQGSALGRFMAAAARAVTLRVYLDDVSISSDDPDLLAEVYAGLCRAVLESGFGLNDRKSAGPARRVELFGCVLEQGRAAVSEDRRDAFAPENRGGWSAEWFERYCGAVESGNWRRTHVRAG